MTAVFKCSGSGLLSHFHLIECLGVTNYNSSCSIITSRTIVIYITVKKRRGGGVEALTYLSYKSVPSSRRIWKELSRLIVGCLDTPFFKSLKSQENILPQKCSNYNQETQSLSQ